MGPEGPEVPIQVKVPPYFLVPPVCGSEVTVATGLVAGEVVAGAAVVVAAVVAAGLDVAGDVAEVVGADEVAAVVVVAGAVVVLVPQPATIIATAKRIANGMKYFFKLSS